MERRMGNISSLVLKCTLATASWDAIVIWDWSFSFSFLAPFFFFFTLLCKDSAMLLCQSMYNHTTNYGDMFIWEMAAIPIVHLSRLLTRFSHPWFVVQGSKLSIGKVQLMLLHDTVLSTEQLCVSDVSPGFFLACIWSPLLLASFCANPCENLTMWRIFSQSLREEKKSWYGYGTVTGTVRQIVKRMHGWNLHGEIPRWIEARMLNSAVLLVWNQHSSVALFSGSVIV